MRKPLFTLLLLTVASSQAHGFTLNPTTSYGRKTVSLNVKEIEMYEYKDWKLTYRFSESQSKQTVILIHPVGIGINSWIWDRVMDESGGTTLAPDLIGCGVPNGASEWDPTAQGLSFPLAWAQAIEELLQQKGRDYTVVVQGGLAPVGVLLASRNPDKIRRLVLTSPPTWQQMTTPVPSKELERNFYFLYGNQLISNLAFGILEQSWAVRFFSDLFLFSEKCDDLWVQTCMANTAGMRAPIAAFNAGFCNHRSFEIELKELDQPTLILQGEQDQRQRRDYVVNMKNCQLKVIESGCNVLPWENPTAVCSALQHFI